MQNDLSRDIIIKLGLTDIPPPPPVGVSIEPSTSGSPPSLHDASAPSTERAEDQRLQSHNHFLTDNIYDIVDTIVPPIAASIEVSDSTSVLVTHETLSEGELSGVPSMPAGLSLSGPITLRPGSSSAMDMYAMLIIIVATSV